MYRQQIQRYYIFIHGFFLADLNSLYTSHCAGWACTADSKALFSSLSRVTFSSYLPLRSWKSCSWVWYSFFRSAFSRTAASILLIIELCLSRSAVILLSILSTSSCRCFTSMFRMLSMSLVMATTSFSELTCLPSADIWFSWLATRRSRSSSMSFVWARLDLRSSSSRRRLPSSGIEEPLVRLLAGWAVDCKAEILRSASSSFLRKLSRSCVRFCEVFEFYQCGTLH